MGHPACRNGQSRPTEVAAKFWENHVYRNAASEGAVTDDDIVEFSRSARKRKEKRSVIRPQGSTSRLLPRSYFLEFARREQLRALRLKSHATLVILSSENSGSSAQVDLYNLSKLVEGQIRETDLIGWWAEDAIALLLADTDKRGVQDCVARICAEAPERAFTPRILAYPETSICSSQAPHLNATDLHHRVLSLPARQTPVALATKRGMDILGSLLALLVFSPVMLLTALAIKATSRGPVIFSQMRLGHRGVPFVFYKFRSMRTDAGDAIHREYVHSLIKGSATDVNHGDAQNPLFKIKQDPRITRVGAFIRKFSIDELPQLYNVLKGDMSLVGPRPPIPYEVEAYSPWHLRRILEVKPGVTGLWQVEGRSQVAFDDMVRLDLRYAMHWSLRLDANILLKTAKVVLEGRGSV
jgi:lipopolysaccharide/colanic/teichoic acid biosynthesis glycosyltransferase